MTGRRATCHGHVRVDDPEMKLTSEWLITELPQANEHVSHIVAETNVVIDSMGDQGQTNHATCARAVYNYEVKDGTTNELVTLTGNATVENAEYIVTGEPIAWNRANNLITAIHQLIIPRKGLINANASAPSTPAAPKTSGAESQTRISSDWGEFDMTGRRATCHGHVRMDDPEMKLTGEWLITELPPAGAHISHIVAETNVVIDFADEKGQTNHVTGDKAVYLYSKQGGVTNETVTLTGNPRMENAQGTQAGDVIVWNRVNNKFHFDNPYMIPRQNINGASPDTNTPVTVEKTNFPPGTIENIDKNISDHLSDHINHPPF
jgi:lipopolysaccharide export system protein LptA